ncbi:TetR family transcriptional regulator [Microtetraspora sp. NBRC 13810]|uniref:TetR/AcrR family transcriptional regulator n=1 Tax=Microtetraspora sp. NBRC 13810 TaxID=3030990 RepID=UPI0024A327DC|nr:TetR/AcrR family transcriptional regulator [Microtetraspora sp. NBRC 13810]GLW07200.1 TetR family transcriptional regulator [Microtetraspora sp. NBRC 13810]
MAEGVKARRRLETRRRLLTEARRLFARHGYAAVSLAEIVGAAEVTKGALYHNFAGKAELFHVIVEEVQQEVADRVVAAAGADEDPWEQLLAGCRAFLAVSRDPDVQRIMLIDGPAVLGWSEWRAMDEASSARHLTEALTALIEDGTIAGQPVEPLAHLLSGAMNEAALWLARSTGPDDLPAVTAALTRMLESLRR